MNYENHENLRIPIENRKNHENLRIPYENHENQESVEFQTRRMKIMKIKKQNENDDYENLRIPNE